MEDQSQSQQQTPNPLSGIMSANQNAMMQAAAQKKKLADEANIAPPDMASVSKALNVLQDKSSAGKVGGALNTNSYSNLCLKYVDDTTGNQNRQPTAYADYQVNARSGNINTSGTPPKGARVYFAPTQDNPAGHIGISLGNNMFRGATTNDGIKDFSISDWSKYANQQYIGWAPPNSK